MTVLSQAGNYIISSSFGASIVEGTNGAGTLGPVVSFTISQVVPVYSSFYYQIQPLTGSHSDFWEDFFSNIIGGEPADEFSNGGFTSRDVLIKINPDAVIEGDESFRISFYLSVLDPGRGVSPVASATFVILDDEPLLLNGDAQANLLEGRAGADTIVGGDGSDTLLGGIGNDFLDGGLGDDSSDGGQGNDTYFTDNLDTIVDRGTFGIDTVVVNFATPSAFNIYYLPTSAEWLVLGQHAVIGAGNASANQLQGNAAVNTLYGGDGADTLIGLGSSDWLQCDAGQDFAYGGEGADVIGGGADNDWLVGDAGADTIYGDEGNDVISGGEGNDYIFGGVGFDLIYGGAGNDTFLFARADQNDIVFGEAGGDTLYFGDRQASEFVSLTDFGNGYKTVIFSDGGFTSVTGIEYLQFADRGFAIVS